MNDIYVAVYEEGSIFPCGAMPLESALELLPTLKGNGRDYYTKLITPQEAREIRRDIAVNDPVIDVSFN